MNARWSNDLRYIAVSCLATACATSVLLFDTGALPVVGTAPLLPTIFLAALAGYPLLAFLRFRGVSGPYPDRFSISRMVGVACLGAVLALPPIAIDLSAPFPRDMNLLPPAGLFFYPAIALLAEVVFHLLPLVALSALLPKSISRIWTVLPVVLVEPLFQAAFSQVAGVQSVLVFGSVGLVSAAQLWMFLRSGFLTMLGVRIAFYVFWHILWGTARLYVLF